MPIYYGKQCRYSDHLYAMASSTAFPTRILNSDRRLNKNIEKHLNSRKQNSRNTIMGLQALKPHIAWPLDPTHSFRFPKRLSESSGWVYEFPNPPACFSELDVLDLRAVFSSPEWYSNDSSSPGHQPQFCQAFSHAELMALKKIKLGKMPRLQHQNGASKCGKQSSEVGGQFASACRPSSPKQLTSSQRTFHRRMPGRCRDCLVFSKVRIILRRHRCSKTVGIRFKATSSAMHSLTCRASRFCPPSLVAKPCNMHRETCVALCGACQCRPQTATDLKPEGTELTIF